MYSLKLTCKLINVDILNKKKCDEKKKMSTDFLCLSHDFIVNLYAGLVTGSRLATCVFFILQLAFRC